MIRSPRWALLRRFTLTDVNGRRYLDRLRIVQTPWGGIFLHRLGGPDPGRDLHDHPYWFASLVLRGGYSEAITDAGGPDERRGRWTMRHHCAGRVHTVRLDQFHRIARTKGGRPCWTLLLVGPRRRRWGFDTAAGFVDYADYERLGLGAQVQETGR